jgi:hypothetical protein
MRDNMTDDTNVTGHDNADDSQNQATGGAPDTQRNVEHMIPKGRFDQVVNQRKAAESALEELATEMVEEIPEDMRDIIPDLPAAARIKWMRTAMKKGLFGGNAPEGLDVKRPGGKPPTNFDGMTPAQIMAQGYGQKT